LNTFAAFAYSGAKKWAAFSKWNLLKHYIKKGKDKSFCCKRADEHPGGV